MTIKKALQKLGNEIPAVVVSAGLMEKTVKARVGIQQWNDHIKKNFNRRKNVLVHDPNDSLRTGDIITVAAGWRVSKTVHHVVHKIIAPFGTPAKERPPVPSLKEMIMMKQQRKALKLEMRRRRRLGLPTDDLIKSNEDNGFPLHASEDEGSVDNGFPLHASEDEGSVDNGFPLHASEDEGSVDDDVDADKMLEDVATDSKLADSMKNMNVFNDKERN
ncbi:hypothetical protein K3495_g6612 [Podosphaera aphanis]|nr:hypothetical protein K3495_g6612 [Podosphaera aphanis]